MKQSYTVTVRLSEDLMRKLLFISEVEGRTPNNQFAFMLRNNIQYFEKVKGKIPPAALARYDLQPYAPASDEEKQVRPTAANETEDTQS